jgi:hypothetical protein
LKQKLSFGGFSISELIVHYYLEREAPPLQFSFKVCVALEMSGEPRKYVLAESLLEDSVKIELLPEKKGFLKKHAEYLITSTTHGIQVSVLTSWLLQDKVSRIE